MTSNSPTATKKRYSRKALSEAFAPAIKTQGEADAVAALIDTLAPSDDELDEIYDRKFGKD